MIPAGRFVTVDAGETTIPGWTVTGSSVDWVGTYWQASNGSASIDLSGNAAGGVQQTITGLDTSKTYKITFDLAGNPDGNPPVKTADVAVGLSGSNYYFDTTGKTRDAMGWQSHYLLFNPKTSSVVLSFTSSTATAYGPALDNVAISSVPETSTWAMMGLGFLGLALAGRRRMRKNAAV